MLANYSTLTTKFLADEEKKEKKQLCTHKCSLNDNTYMVAPT